MNNEPTHIYMNLDVLNNSDEKEEPLVFQETRNIPFLKNSNNYFASVIRFCLQTSNGLPVFIPDIKLGQSNVNMTAYGITMEFRKNVITPGISTTDYVQFRCLDDSLPIPAQPLTTVDRSTTYYWIYNINDWVNLVNETLARQTEYLMSALASLSDGDPYKGFTFNAPFVEYDVTSGLFTLYKDLKVDTSYNTSRSLNIYFNPKLYDILPFSASKVNSLYKINTFGKQNVILKTELNSSSQEVTVQEKYVTVTTEFSPICLMNPIRNIYFTTNTLPVQPTLTQPPKVYSNTSLSSSSGLPDISNILTDFSIPVSATNNYNGELIYQPGAEYRLLNMNSSFNLNKIDLSAFWSDKFGNSYPIYLQPGCSANLKLMMRHKSFNMSSW